MRGVGLGGSDDTVLCALLDPISIQAMLSGKNSKKILHWGAFDFFKFVGFPRLSLAALILVDDLSVVGRAVLLTTDS